MTENNQNQPGMQLEEPQKPAEGSQAPDPRAEMADVLAELERIGVKKPEQVANMARASSEAGRLANMVGEIRRENAELRRIIEQSVTKPQAQSWDGSPDTVDLGKLVEQSAAKAVRGFYEEQVLKPQMQAREMLYRQMEEVQNDDDYPVVKDVFEQHIQAPRTQQALASGQTSLTNEYDRVVKQFYRKALGRSRDLLKSLHDAGAKPGAKTVPHMESGTGNQYVPPEQKPDTKAKLVEIRKQSRGRDDDIDRMLDAILPNDDPFMARR